MHKIIKKTFILLIVTLIPYHTLANGKPKKPIRISLMSFFSGQQVFRGAQYFPHPFFVAGPALTFFDNFHLRGPNLAFTQGERRDLHQYEIGGRLLNDGEPMIEFSDSFNEQTDFRASRKDAFEVYGHYKYKFGFKNLFQIGLLFSKEVHRHKGVFTALSFKAPIYKFTSLHLKTGVGSKEHNKYLYGLDGKSGLTHQKLSLSYALTNLPWQGIVLFQTDYSWILASENQNADRIRGRHKQFNLSSRLIWNVY